MASALLPLGAPNCVVEVTQLPRPPMGTISGAGGQSRLKGEDSLAVRSSRVVVKIPCLLGSLLSPWSIICRFCSLWLTFCPVLRAPPVLS
jgi:hypothetical protein